MDARRSWFSATKEKVLLGAEKPMPPVFFFSPTMTDEVLTRAAIVFLETLEESIGIRHSCD